jgi:hypothetical protein
VPADSASGTDLLLTGCFDDSAAGAGSMASKTVAVDVGAGSVLTAEVGCLRNEGDCCFQTKVHQSCACDPPFLCASSLS